MNGLFYPASLFLRHRSHQLKIHEKEILGIGLALVLAGNLRMNAQYAKTDTTYKRWFIGSTLFLVGNLDKVNPPGFAQLNLGYRITGKDDKWPKWTPEPGLHVGFNF